MGGITVKQVIVVNGALKLPPGKMAAQVAHASISAFLRASNERQQEWLNAGMPKIVVVCSFEEDLNRLMSAANDAEIAASLIHDAGKTVLPAGTLTCLGLGPAPAHEVDPIIGELELM